MRAPRPLLLGTPARPARVLTIGGGSKERGEGAICGWQLGDEGLQSQQPLSSLGENLKQSKIVTQTQYTPLLHYTPGQQPLESDPASIRPNHAPHQPQGTGSVTAPLNSPHLLSLKDLKSQLSCLVVGHGFHISALPDLGESLRKSHFSHMQGPGIDTRFMRPGVEDWYRTNAAGDLYVII